MQSRQPRRGLVHRRGGTSPGLPDLGPPARCVRICRSQDGEPHQGGDGAHQKPSETLNPGNLPAWWCGRLRVLAAGGGPRRRQRWAPPFFPIFFGLGGNGFFPCRGVTKSLCLGGVSICVRLGRVGKILFFPASRRLAKARVSEMLALEYRKYQGF